MDIKTSYMDIKTSYMDIKTHYDSKMLQKSMFTTLCTTLRGDPQRGRAWNNYEMIYKKFKFKDFKLAIEFVNKIGDLSEEESHHPDISFGYSYCLVLIHTHAIKGLSINDFILAS